MVGGYGEWGESPRPCTPTPSQAAGRVHQGRFRLLSAPPAAPQRFHFWVWETSGCVRAGQLRGRGFQFWPAGQPGFGFVDTGTRQSRLLVSCSHPRPAPLRLTGGCLPWLSGGALASSGWGEASTSGWRPGPVTFLGLPQAPQDSPHPRPAGEAPGLWERGSLRSLTGLGLAPGRHLQVPLGPLWDLRPVPRLMGFPQPDVLGPESGPQWLLTPEDRRVTHRALGTEEALEDRPRGWGCLGRALPGPSHQLPRR